jgi:rubrerythrin
MSQNNDLISRSALLEEFDWLNRAYPEDCGNEVAEKLVKLIEQAPAVDAEPVEYSMWLEHAGSQNTRYWTCLKCDTLGSPRWKRCPICEAKMDGKHNDIQRV